MLFEKPQVPPVILNRHHRANHAAAANKIAAWVNRQANRMVVRARSVEIEGQNYQIREIDRELQGISADAAWRDLTWRERARHDLLVHARRALQERHRRNKGRVYD